MKVPIVDNVLNVIGEGFEWLNEKDKRRRQAVIRSARKLVQHLEGVELPPKAAYYKLQLKVRLSRLS